MIIKPLSDEQRARIDAAIQAGESNRSISKRLGVAASTVKRRKDKMEGYTQQHTPPPTPSFELPPIGNQGEGGPPKAQTDPRFWGRVAALPFKGISMLPAFGPGWQLTPQERSDMGNGIAECIPLLPAKVADQMVEYSAPLNLGMILVDIIFVRMIRVMFNVEAIKEEIKQEIRAEQVQQTVGARDIPPPPPPPRPGSSSPPTAGGVEAHQLNIEPLGPIATAAVSKPYVNGFLNGTV